MEYAQDREGTAESDRGSKLYVRVTGFVLAFFGLIFLISLAVSYLQEDPFQGHVLKRCKAVITSVNRGTSKHFLRSYQGYFYHYQFTVDHQTHTGQFFNRSNKYYQVGHEIEIEYRADHPDINRWAQSSSSTASSFAVMDFVMAIVYAGLFIIGAIMFKTGRALKRQW